MPGEFDASSPEEYRDRQLHAPLPSLSDFRPELKGRIQSVLEIATRKNPAERYPTARAMSEDFHQALARR